MSQPPSRFTRRSLGIGSVAALAPTIVRGQLATPMPTTVPASLAGSTLRLLTWTRPVAGFDAVFEGVVRNWADRNGVGLTVDWMLPETMIDAVMNEVSLGYGHDLIDAPLPMPQFQPAMLDLSATFDDLTKVMGVPVTVCAESTMNPVTRVRWGIVYGWEPAVAIFRGSLWQEAGLPWGPTTTDDLLTGGTWIWNERGAQVALGLAPIPLAEVAAQTLIWATGGAVQDAGEQVVLASDGTNLALASMRDLFWQTTTPVVLEWRSDQDVTNFMQDGFGSYTIGGLHHLRSIAETKPEMAADLMLAPPPGGPDGLVPGRAMPISLPTLMIPRWNASPGGAEALTGELVAQSNTLLMASQLVYLPAFPATVPNLFTESGPLQHDPFDTANPGKTLPLVQSPGWTVGAGWPGPANPMVEAGHRQGLLATMMADAATESLRAADAATLTADAFTLLAQPWRDAGLMKPASNEGIG